MLNPKFIVLVTAVFLSLHRLESTNAAESIQDVKIDISFKKFVLTNGLTLIVHEDHKAPIVAVNLWYHVSWCGSSWATAQNSSPQFAVSDGAKSNCSTPMATRRNDAGGGQLRPMTIRVCGQRARNPIVRC